MSSPGIKDFKVTCVFSIYSWPADSFPLNYDQNGLQFIDGDQVLMDNILKYGFKSAIKGISVCIILGIFLKFNAINLKTTSHNAVTIKVNIII